MHLPCFFLVFYLNVRCHRRERWQRGLRRLQRLRAWCKTFLRNVFALKMCFYGDAFPASTSISVTIRWLNTSINSLLPCEECRARPSVHAVEAVSTNSPHITALKCSWLWDEGVASSVVGQLHWRGRANTPLDLRRVVRTLYTSTHVHTSSLHCVLHPADTTCSGHVLVLLLDCSAVYERSVTICTDGTARRRARDVFCVCLVTDLSSVHACGGERPSVHRCCLWLSAFWWHQACRWASDCGPLMFCVNMWPRCSGHAIYTEKGEKMSPLNWMSLLTVLLPVEFILCIISVILGNDNCEKDSLLSHTNVTAKDRNSLFFLK